MTKHAVPAAARRLSRPAVPRGAGAGPLARDFASSTARWTQTADGPRWVFYEGPPTANGKPGAHHVEARVFKDLFPRFKTMKGYHVPRRAGWDCHGLPVELAIEKELGFTGKHDIEAYGVAAFNEKCRESVLRHVDEFERLTERMGYWTDMAGAYRTMDTSYIESVWWSLKTIWDKGLLVQDYRVAPYCPRCQTALSDHEVALGYTDLVDPSVYVRFPVVDQPYDLLVWTTTPWTLVSNTAVAVHPEVDLRGRRGPRRAPGPGRRSRWSRAIAGPDAEVLRDDPGTRPRRARVRAPARPDRRGRVRRRGPPGRARRLRDRRGRHRPGAPGARVRRRGPRSRPPLRARRGQPDPADGTFAAERPAGRRHVLQDGRRGPGRRAASGAACCGATSRTSTATRSAGGATPPCSTTRSRPGTSARPRSRTGCSTRTRPPTGTRRGSRTAGTANGCAATSTGRSRVTATGAPRCRSGSAADEASTGSASARWPSWARSPAQDLSALDPHRPFVDDVVLPCARVRRPDAPRARGHRRLVRLRRDAVRPVGRAAPPARPSSRRATRRSTSARRSTRPAAGSTR